MSFAIRPGPYIPPSYLEDPPLVPNENDDEFDDLALGAAWTRVGTFDDVNAIDPYAGFSTGARSSYNAWRKSWIMIQPSSNGSLAGYRRLLTLPTDCFVWHRSSFTFRLASQANNDGTLTMSLSTDDVLTDAVQISLNETDASVARTHATKITAGSSTSIGAGGNIGGGSTGEAQPFCFTGIQKLGTTYHFFAAPEQGAWQWMGSTTHSSTFTRVLLLAGNTVQTAPGNIVMGFDFFRFKSGKYLP